MEVILYFLDLMCKKFWILNNYDYWKFNRNFYFKFNKLDNKFMLGPMAHATVIHIKFSWMAGSSQHIANKYHNADLFRKEIKSVGKD
jgi:hypothetical protein